MRHHATSRSRGYSLVELMAVIAMIAIMAALAVAGYRRYMQWTKTAEGKDLVTSIAAGQIRYFEDTEGYLDCSDNLTDYYPGAPNRQKRTFRDQGNPKHVCWDLLGIDSQAPSYFGFVTMAGLPAESPPNLPTTGTFAPDPGRPWFIVMGVSNIDDDATLGYMTTTSFAPGDVAMVNEDE